MCDSITIRVVVDGIVDDGLKNRPWPIRVDSIYDQHGEIVAVKPAIINEVSPLTGAKFYIRPFFDNKNSLIGKLAGYEISVNPPACMIGNNALIHIRVYLAIMCSLQLLKFALLKLDASARAVRQISVKHVTVESITMTYLIPFDSYEEALEAERQLEEHARAILNTNHRNPKAPKPVVTVE
jgi:hypothetical protein